MMNFFYFIPVILIFLPILTSILLYIVKKPKFTKVIFLSQLTLTVFIILYIIFWHNNPDQNIIVFGNHHELIGISLKVDIYSIAFILLTNIIWWVVMLYAYPNNKNESKFFFFLMFLQGVFYGLIQTNDLFNMFVFLELITVLVTILIVYKKSGTSFRSGIYYLLLNTLGAMIFLIGVMMLYYTYGTINISAISDQIQVHSESTTVKLAYVFMMAGISVKAALVPVFTWLPKAHGVAQSCVSALLSGLVVKGALYIFIRINVDMYSNASYQTQELFYWIGTITALVGVAFALSQKDMKQILAFHTISQVGIMMMGLSTLEGYSFFGGLLHIFNHAFFKSLLFLGAGMIITNYQTKKVGEVRGLFKTMPLLSILMIIGMLSISGAPFFNGFISKSFVKYASSDNVLKTILFYIINLGTITSFIKFSQVFFGPKQQIKTKASKFEYSGMIILASFCVMIGLSYIPITTVFDNLGLPNLTALNWFSIVEYAAFVFIGYILYIYFISKDYKPTRVIRNFKLSFENSNYLFILYLIVLTLLVMF